MNFIVFVEENYQELCKLIVGKSHQAFGLLCTRIQDYPVNSVDLSQNCRAYLQRNLEINSRTNLSKIFKELKDKDLLRPIPSEPGLYMINPNYVFRGKMKDYESYVDKWNQLV